MNKKLLLVFMVIAMLMTGCSRTEPASGNTSTPVSDEPVVTSTPDDETPTATPSASTPNAPEATPEAQPSEADIDLLVPAGWHIFVSPYDDKPQVIKGDLNGDGRDDAVIVIEKNEPEVDEYDFEFYRRAMLIAFNNGNNGFDLSIKTEIRDANSGGVWGDPYDGITIENGDLTLAYYGGSNYRWYYRYVFRFIDDEWYLIGYTEGNYFTGDTTMEDADEFSYNYLTGDYTERIKDENGNMVINQSNIGVQELHKMSEVDLQ